MILRALIQECSTSSLIHLVRAMQHLFSPGLIIVSRGSEEEERRAQSEKEGNQADALESRSGLLSLKPGIVAGKHEGKSEGKLGLLDGSRIYHKPHSCFQSEKPPNANRVMGYQDTTLPSVLVNARPVAW
jgi:hypothetical protein